MRLSAFARLAGFGVKTILCRKLFSHTAYRYISCQIVTVHMGFPNFLGISLLSVTHHT